MWLRRMSKEDAKGGKEVIKNNETKAVAKKIKKSLVPWNIYAY